MDRTSATADVVNHNIRPSVPAACPTDVFQRIDRVPESRRSFPHQYPWPRDVPPPTRGPGIAGGLRTAVGPGTAAGVSGAGGGGALLPAWGPVVGVPWRTVMTVRREVVHTAGPPPPPRTVQDMATARPTRDLSWTPAHPQPQRVSTSTQVNPTAPINQSVNF